MRGLSNKILTMGNLRVFAYFNIDPEYETWVLGNEKTKPKPNPKFQNLSKLPNTLLKISESTTYTCKPNLNLKFQLLYFELNLYMLANIPFNVCSGDGPMAAWWNTNHWVPGSITATAGIFWCSRWMTVSLAILNSDRAINACNRSIWNVSKIHQFIKTTNTFLAIGSFMPKSPHPHIQPFVSSFRCLA